MIDGAEQEILVSSDKAQEKMTFSGKMQLNTVTQLIIVVSDGTIYFISTSNTGNKADSNLYFYPKNAVYEHLDQDEWVALDQEFQGAEAVHPTVFQIHERCMMTVDDTAFNTQFKSICITVENSITHICHCQITKPLYCAKTSSINDMLEEHHMMWTVAAAFVNLFVMPIKRYD